MRKIIILGLIVVLSGCITKGTYKVVGKKSEVPIEELKKIDETTREVKVTDEGVKKVEEVKKSEKLEKETKESERNVVKEVKEVKEEGKLARVKKKRKIENKSFNVGEKLTFAIQYLGITAGIAVIEVKEMVNVDGNKALHIVSTVKSTPFFSTFNKVEDRVESFVDSEGIFSRKLIKSLREGNYSRDVVLYYDQDKNIVKEVEKSGEKVYNIPEFCQDILSAFYYFRTQKIEVGKDNTVDVYADGKCYRLKVKVLKKEKIRVPLGKYETFAIKPFMEFESVFKQEGDVTIWCTTDNKHIPVLMKSKAFVGSINATLIDAVVTK